MFQGGSVQPLGTLAVGGPKSHHIPGVGGGPLDAFPGQPLLRHKASFLPSVPQLPRGAWGAWLGVKGGLIGRDIPMPFPRWLGQGHGGVAAKDLS